MFAITACLANLAPPSKQPPVDPGYVDTLARLQASQRVANITHNPGSDTAGRKLYHAAMRAVMARMPVATRATLQLAGQYSLHLRRQLAKSVTEKACTTGCMMRRISASLMDPGINAIPACLSVLDDD